MKLMPFAIILLTLVSIMVEADNSDEISILVGVGTYHFSKDPEHNNRNDIIGLLTNNWFITRYTNSHKGESWGFGYTIGNWQVQPTQKYPVTLKSRIWAGAATGYGDRLKLHWGPFTMALIPEFATEIRLTDHWATGLSSLYIWTEQGGVLVNGVQLKYRF